MYISPWWIFEFFHCRLVTSLKEYLSRTDFNWNINKIHAIAHLKADIQRSGSTHQFNAELYENLHQKVQSVFIIIHLIYSHSASIQVVKQPHRLGNKRKKESSTFLMKKHNRSYVLAVIKRYVDIEKPKSRESNWDIVSCCIYYACISQCYSLVNTHLLIEG